MEILKSTIKPVLPLPTKFMDVFNVKYAPHGRLIINQNETRVLLICYFSSHENTIIDKNRTSYSYDSDNNLINLTFYAAEKDHDPGQDVIIHTILNYDEGTEFYANAIDKKARIQINIMNEVVSLTGEQVKKPVTRSVWISTDPIQKYPPLYV